MQRKIFLNAANVVPSGNAMQSIVKKKTVDLTQITKGTLGVTISVNGQEVGDKQEVKINKSDVLDIHIDWAIDNDRKPTSNTTIQYQLPVILKTVPMTGTIWGPG